MPVSPFGETQPWSPTSPQGGAVLSRSNPPLLSSRDFLPPRQAPSHGLGMAELDDGGISKSGGDLRDAVASKGQEPKTKDLAENTYHAPKGGNVEGGRPGGNPQRGRHLAREENFRGEEGSA